MKTSLLRVFFFILLLRCGGVSLADDSVAYSKSCSIFKGHDELVRHKAPECSLENESTESSVLVTVKILEASGEGEIDKLPSELEELRNQLSKIGYSSFKEISKTEKRVTLLKKTKIGLYSGHALLVRALDVSDDGRVGLWLRWRDKQGATLLDTRMHFGFGETMVTGSENEEGRNPVVLAISVQK